MVLLAKSRENDSLDTSSEGLLLKVLLVIEGVVPEQANTSPTIRYWRAAIRNLVDEHGIALVLVTLREAGELLQLGEGLGIRAVAMGCETKKQFPRTIRTLANILREERIDVIHASETTPAALAFVASRLTGEGVRIFHRHHFRIPEQPRLFSRIANQSADMIIAVSQAVADHVVQQEGIAPQKVAVTLNGVAPFRRVSSSEARSIRHALQVQDDDRIVLALGRHRSEKGFDVLVKAMQHLPIRLRQHTHLVIVGSGPTRDILQETAMSLEGCNIHFVEHQIDPAPWFSISDLVAVPSTSEPFGMVVAEAMISKRPLVASSTGGIKELIEDGHNGLLVKPNRPVDLAHGIRTVLENATLSRRLAARAYELASSALTIEAMVGGWILSWNNAMNMRHTRHVK